MLCVTSRPKPVLESKLIQLGDRKKLLTNTGSCQWVISVSLLPVVPQPSSLLGFIPQDDAELHHKAEFGICLGPVAPGAVPPDPISWKSQTKKIPRHSPKLPLKINYYLKKKPLLGSFILKACFCIHLITSCSWVPFSMSWCKVHRAMVSNILKHFLKEGLIQTSA